MAKSNKQVIEEEVIKLQKLMSWWEYYTAIDNPGTGNTPAYTGSEATFNGQTSTLQTYDATVVGTKSMYSFNLNEPLKPT